LHVGACGQLAPSVQVLSLEREAEFTQKRSAMQEKLDCLDDGIAITNAQIAITDADATVSSLLGLLGSLLDFGGTSSPSPVPWREL